MRRRLVLIAIALLVTVASCSKTGTGRAAVNPAAGTAGESASPPPAPNDYSRPASWLCLPGRDDYCNVDLTATVISADGDMAMEPWAPNDHPEIDCFYVYPVVSRDKSGNSDIIPGPGEIDIVRTQFARFAEVCRPYAPMYRQVTLTALGADPKGNSAARGDRQLAYTDIRDAWHYYLSHYNQGRGVVLIGDARGAGLLATLISNEIDGKPVEKRLVSAILAGNGVPVPAGKLVGGAFAHIPLCTANTETGCVITYAAFRDDVASLPDSDFGEVKEKGMVAGCTNPAALVGGSGELDAYLSAKTGGGSGQLHSVMGASEKPVTTPFVSLPGMLTAQCVDNAHGSYLSVTVHGSLSDPRADGIVGAGLADGKAAPEWALHQVDLNLAMGNLLDIVTAQTQAYTAAATPGAAH